MFAEDRQGCTLHVSYNNPQTFGAIIFPVTGHRPLRHSTQLGSGSMHLPRSFVRWCLMVGSSMSLSCRWVWLILCTIETNTRALYLSYWCRCTNTRAWRERRRCGNVHNVCNSRMPLSLVLQGIQTSLYILLSREIIVSTGWNIANSANSMVFFSSSCCRSKASMHELIATSGKLSSSAHHSERELLEQIPSIPGRGPIKSRVFF